MQKIKIDQLLDQLIIDTENIIKAVKMNFIHLANEQLCWRPLPDKWSINECIKHLTVTLNIYLPAIEKGIKNLPAEYTESAPFFYPTFLGNMATKSMKPAPEGKIRYKMKTFDKLDPRKIINQSEDIFTQFLAQQEELKFLVINSGEVNLNLIRIPLIIKFIKFKLGDTFRFIIAHNQRHILQAYTILHLPNFPKRNM
jgi:hypothetical protein